MPEGCAHKPLALLQDEGGGVGHTLQGLSHSSHHNAHKVASAVAQQVIDGRLAHRAHTWRESSRDRNKLISREGSCGQTKHIPEAIHAVCRRHWMEATAGRFLVG